MNHNNVLEKIVIIDYGSQFTQLIARKVRELGVYSEIINLNQIRGLKKNLSVVESILRSSLPIVDADNYVD